MTKRIITRVIGSLILAAIFGLIAKSAKAVTIVTSGGGPPIGSVTLDITYESAQTRFRIAVSNVSEPSGCNVGAYLQVHATGGGYAVFNWALPYNGRGTGTGLHNGNVYYITASAGHWLIGTTTLGNSPWSGFGQNIDVASTVGPAKKVLVAKFNSASYSVKYRVYGQPSGTLLGEYTAAPNTGVLTYVTLTGSDAGATLTTQALNISRAGEVWSDSPGVNSTEIADPNSLVGVPDTGLPSLPAPSSSNPNNTPPPTGLPGVNTQPSQMPDGATKPTVWSAGTGATTTGNELDKNTFKEGVGKLETAIAKSGGVTDMSGVINKLESIRAQDQAKNEADVESKTDAETSADAAKNAAASQGATKGQELKTVIGNTPTTAPTLTTPGDYSSIMTINLPAAMGGGSINTNPFQNATVKAIANGFRTALTWLSLVLLGGWIWSQMAEWFRALAQSQQAKGNPIFGGTGAQATALLMATAITVAIVVAVTALMAFTFGSISLAVLKDQAAVNPLAGFSAVTVGFLGEFFPLATMISCVIARMTFNMYASGLYAVAITVILYCVA